MSKISEPSFIVVRMQVGELSHYMTFNGRSTEFKIIFAITVNNNCQESLHIYYHVWSGLFILHVLTYLVFTIIL